MNQEQETVKTSQADLKKNQTELAKIKIEIENNPRNGFNNSLIQNEYVNIQLTDLKKTFRWQQRGTAIKKKG